LGSLWQQQEGSWSHWRKDADNSPFHSSWFVSSSNLFPFSDNTKSINDTEATSKALEIDMRLFEKDWEDDEQEEEFALQPRAEEEGMGYTSNEKWNCLQKEFSFACLRTASA